MLFQKEVAKTVKALVLAQCLLQNAIETHRV
jgi:hypothetical protein